MIPVPVRSAPSPSTLAEVFQDSMSNPIVTIEMENGSVMKAELYPEVAPNSVNNFISLIQKGFYDGLIFHRCIPGFIREKRPNSLLWKGGGIRKDDDGGLSHGTFSHLDGGYAAFGKIIEGMETADAIVSAKTDWNDRPRPRRNRYAPSSSHASYCSPCRRRWVSFASPLLLSDGKTGHEEGHRGYLRRRVS